MVYFWNGVEILNKTGLCRISHYGIYGKVHLRDDASIAPYKFHFITRLFVSPKKQKNAAMYLPLHLCILIFYDFISIFHISRPQPIPASNS